MGLLGMELVIAKKALVVAICSPSRGLEGHVSPPEANPADAIIDVASGRPNRGVKPSSLIQKRADQTLRIKYGSQTNQTMTTRAARAQTKILRKRYFAMWLMKTWNGTVLGMLGA